MLKKYYNLIKQGKKKVELRAASDYWCKRVCGASQVVFRLGTLACCLSKFWMTIQWNLKYAVYYHQIFGVPIQHHHLRYGPINGDDIQNQTS